MESPRSTRGNRRRVVAALALAVGIVAGILAMHFGIGPAPGEATSIGVAAVAEHPHHAAPIEAGCGGDCGPPEGGWHLAVACVLGLLVLLLLFAIRSSLRPADDIAVRPGTGQRRATVPLARAPDLDDLCISRT